MINEQKVKKIIDHLFINFLEDYKIENDDSNEDDSEYKDMLKIINKQKNDLYELYVVICNSYKTTIKREKKVILIGNDNHGWDIFQYLLLLKIIFFKLKQIHIFNNICLFCEMISPDLEDDPPLFPNPISNNNIIPLIPIMQNECNFNINGETLDNSVKEINTYWSNIITDVINNDKDKDNHTIYIVSIGRSHILYNKQPNGIIVEPIQYISDYLQNSFMFTLDKTNNKIFLGQTEDKTTNDMIDRNRKFQFYNLTKFDDVVIEYLKEQYTQIIKKKYTGKNDKYIKILNKIIQTKRICNIQNPIRLNKIFKKSTKQISSKKISRKIRSKKNKTKRRQFNEDIHGFSLE
jgi:hypothetical protein